MENYNVRIAREKEVVCLRLYGRIVTVLSRIEMSRVSDPVFYPLDHIQCLFKLL